MKSPQLSREDCGYGPYGPVAISLFQPFSNKNLSHKKMITSCLVVCIQSYHSKMETGEPQQQYWKVGCSFELRTKKPDK